MENYKRFNSNKLTAIDFDRLIPKHLYKFRSINRGLISLLKTNSLWFSKPQDFNDPFDCSLDILMGKTKEEILENLNNTTGLLKLKTPGLQKTLHGLLDNPSLYNHVMNQLHKVYINEKIGVCCMTEDPKNILMWSHYADSHTGVCLEFEIVREGFLYHNVLPVQYRKLYPRFNLSNFKTNRRNFFTMHQQAVCTKSTLWEYEREWRVIVDTGPGAYSFEKSGLRKVIFGARANENTCNKVKSLLQKLNYSSTEMYKMEPLGKSFGLDMRKLD